MSAAELFDFGSGAADAGSSAASIGQTLIEGAQIVGGVLTVAGAVSGNKRLMQVGAGLGLGATAISAFSSLGDASTTGSMKDYGSAPTKELQGYADEASSYNEAAGLANTSPEAMNNLFGAPADTPSDLSSQAGYAEGLSPADNGVLFDAAQQTPTAPTTAAPTAGTTTPPNYSLSPGAIGGSEGVAIQGSSLGQNTSSLSSASNRLNNQQPGLIGRTMGWLNDRENAGIIKLGTGLIGGAMQGYQQERALDEQRRARDEQRQYVEDQRTRYNQSILGQNLRNR